MLVLCLRLAMSHDVFLKEVQGRSGGVAVGGVDPAVFLLEYSVAEIRVDDSAGAGFGAVEFLDLPANARNVVERSLLRIRSHFELAFPASATPGGEFVNFGGEIIVRVRLVGIESRALPDNGIASGAESVEGKLEPTDGSL